MSTIRHLRPDAETTPATPREHGSEAARVQAALDAGGLKVTADETGAFDARAFAEAVMARWPKVMQKLGE
ncbi:hypothetical protein [Ancylobacter sp.]|uniref:hypothetical protein n=1 Tax=Ancylobacter sp. TaxID=1872567 RepID=UPI003D1433DE